MILIIEFHQPNVVLTRGRIRAKVLIVDDSETLRVQLRRQLEEGGFTVVEGHDSVDGLVSRSSEAWSSSTSKTFAVPVAERIRRI